MDNEYDCKLRVFRHELGHYVAQQLNRQIYNAEGTEHIKIIREEHNQIYDYRGATRPKNSEEAALLRHPASAIASKAYGCIFQCLFYEHALGYCLDARGIALHGHHDFEGIHAIIYKATGGLSRTREVLSITNDYFKKIKDNPDTGLLKMDFDDLLSSKEEECFIDLEKLNKRMANFLALHADSYKELVDELEACLSAPLQGAGDKI